MQLNVLPNRSVQLLGHLLIASAEVPDLRRHATDHIQRQFTLKGFAQPPFLGKLLQRPGAFALGVSPR
jgi:hypothetical protein